MDFATLVILFYRLHVDWTLFSIIGLIADNEKIPGQGFPPPLPYPTGNSKIHRGPEASMDGVHHRNLPGIFSSVGYFSQVNHQMIAAS